MFTQMFTEAGKKGFTPRNSNTEKPLTKPLTDSEIKQLAAYRKREANPKKSRHGLIYFTKDSRDWGHYQNLVVRENIPQKNFELKTMAQITKSKKIGSIISAIHSIVYGNNSPYNLKYLDKSEKLKKEYYTAFTEEYKDKIIKMYKSPAYKKLVMQNIKDNVEEQEYNEEIPKDVINWALDIIAKGSIDSASVFDGYKLYQYLTIDKSTESWTSGQGASMTTKKAKVIFDYDKEYKKDFDLGTSGYWND